MNKTHATGQPTSIPTPSVGVGSSGLDTTTDDPKALRSLLEQARERLSFYEGFERIMAESTRRNGELMSEALSVRDEARRQLASSQAERAALDGLGEELSALRASFDGLSTTFQALSSDFDQLNSNLQTFGGKLTEAQNASAVTEDLGIQDVIPEPVHEAPTFAATPEPLPEPVLEHAFEPEPVAAAEVTPTPAVEEGPVSMDVVVDGVNRAATALSLQRYLRELDVVSVVVAKEFAGGILRLKVDANRPIEGGDLRNWSEGGRIEVRESRPHFLDLVLPE